MDDLSKYLRPPGEDKLDAARNGLRAARDLDREIAELDERLKASKSQLNELRHRRLVDLFQEAGIDRLGLPAEGNHPAYDAKLRPYYKANIPVEWPDQQRAEAFRVLRDTGHDEIVRTVVAVSFGAGEAHKARELADYLRKQGYAPETRMGVPWTTLTALVRAEHEADRPFTSEQLEKIGAQVGSIVEQKPRKDT